MRLVEIETMKALMDLWCKKRGRIVSKEDVNQRRDRRDGNEAELEEKVLESDCVERGTGLSVWLWLSSAAHLRQIQLRMRSRVACGDTSSRN